MTPRVLYYCPFASASGYGRAAADYAVCLLKAGVDLKIQALEDGVDTDHLEKRYQWLVPYATRDDDFRPTHVIVHTIPQYCHEFVTTDLDPGPGVKKIALTTWETDKLPSLAAERLAKNFDLVLTPSLWNDDLMKLAGQELGYFTKTGLAFHSFDPDFWYDPPFWNKPLSPYTFYAISEWNERKNLVGLLKAYYTAFGDRPERSNVKLKIICKAYHEQSVSDLALASGFSNLPTVEWRGMHPNRLNEKDLRELHRSAHCFVTLSRGEGWGLGAFEAALMGNHVIYTDYSGHQTFMPYTHKRSPIRYMPTPVVDAKLEKPIQWCAGLEIPATADVPGFGFDGTQTWAEPDLEQAVTAMRAAAAAGWGTDGGCLEDDVIHEKFKRKFSHEAVGQQLLKILENV